MKFIDLDTGELRALKTACPVESETSKRGSSPKYAIQFVRDAVVIELAGTVAVILGIKAKSGFDSVSYIYGPFTAAKTGTGTDTVYTFPLSFLTAAGDQLLATNLDDVELEAEIKWSSTGENGETLKFDWIVQNNVNRGGESVSSYPVTAVTTRLPAVSRLTGGLPATDLDAQLLAGYANGTVLEVVTDNISGSGLRGESRWEKRVGAEVATDLGNGFILCTDGTRLYRVAG
jgi:hypothetical protein